ncbi:DUF4190 domain-containing protein [Actinophytocola sp.]|uniref:DUF4190 domain-containing protein n=1 Tax=Actinophytocola sp. TaxID=1872138 RepID=UPI002ED572D6
MTTPEPPNGPHDPWAVQQQPFVEPPIVGMPYNPQELGVSQPQYPPAPTPPQPYYPPAPQQFQQPGPYQQPYGYPMYGAQPSTNGMAIASMVLGILWLYWVGSILALIFGYVARDQIKKNGQSGDGMAIAGIVLGWVGVGFLLLGLVGLAAYF